LRSCPACGKLVGATVGTCPHCGYRTFAVTKAIGTGILLIFAVCVTILALILIVEYVSG
jgi:uncharacterized OB-fold protein